MISIILQRRGYAKKSIAMNRPNFSMVPVSVGSKAMAASLLDVHSLRCIQHYPSRNNIAWSVQCSRVGQQAPNMPGRLTAPATSAPSHHRFACWQLQKRRRSGRANSGRRGPLATVAISVSKPDSSTSIERMARAGRPGQCSKLGL